MRRDRLLRWAPDATHPRCYTLSSSSFLPRALPALQIRQMAGQQMQAMLATPEGAAQMSAMLQAHPMARALMDSNPMARAMLR